MKDFFRNWRRRVGVVTLVLSCLSAAAMIHTVSMFDTLHLSSSQSLPYSWLSASLTLLSAWLILSKGPEPRRESHVLEDQS
jgi:hypothetical protein